MPDPFTTEELTDLRGEVQSFMSDTCTITRVTRTSDPYGGESSVETVVATNVPCDITPQVQAMRPTDVIAEQIEVRQLYNVAVPPATDVRFHDLLTVTSWTPNKELVVQSVLVPASRELERQCICSVEGEPVA